MNPRLFIGIAAGCVAGFAGGWFLKPGASTSSADNDKSSVRIAKLEADLKSRSDDVERLTKAAEKKPEAGKAVADTRSRDRRPDAAARAEGAKQFQDRMKQRLEEKQKLKLDERVAVLKKRLGLSDEQAASIRAILEKSPAGAQDALARALTGGAGKEADRTAAMLEILRPGQKNAELNSQISALLTPEQQEAYTAFRQEQRTNEVEVKANKELARMQASLTLSPEQKDKAFAVLTKLADGEYDNPVSPMAGLMQQQMQFMPEGRGDKGLKEHADEVNAAAELATQRQKQRVDAMREFLTEEQVALYENQQKQNSMADMMDGSLGDLTNMMMEGMQRRAPAAPAKP
jgi:hypothetical protein